MISSKIYTLLALFFVILTLSFGANINTANAGLISKLVREAGDAGSKAGKHVDVNIPNIEVGQWLTKSLKKSDDTAAIALLPGKDGTWRIIGEGDLEISIHSLDELGDDIGKAMVRPGKKLAGGTVTKVVKLKKATIAVREIDFLKMREQLVDLPKNTKINIVSANGRVFPLQFVKTAAGSVLNVKLSNTIFLNPLTTKALQANLNFLGRGIKKADLKIGSFNRATDVAKTSNLTDTIVDINPDILESSLSKFKNKTLLLSGKIVKNAKTGKAHLVVKDGKGKTEIDIAALEQSAARQRVNLMLVDAKTVQPGKKLFSKTGIEKRFAKSNKAVTQMDLIQAIAPKNKQIILNTSGVGDTRVAIASNFEKTAGTPKNISDFTDATDYSATSWIFESGLRSSARAIQHQFEDPQHTDEVDGRWIPWFSNTDLILAVILSSLFAFSLNISWKWWKMIMHKYFHQFFYYSKATFLNRILKTVGFICFAIITFIPAFIALLIGGYIQFFTWPFRKLYSYIKSKQKSARA